MRFVWHLHVCISQLDAYISILIAANGKGESQGRMLHSIQTSLSLGNDFLLLKFKAIGELV